MRFPKREARIQEHASELIEQLAEGREFFAYKAQFLCGFVGVRRSVYCGDSHSLIPIREKNASALVTPGRLYLLITGVRGG
jgi:hypothetical protein